MGESLAATRTAGAPARERLFFGGMAVLAALVVFAGFAPTYYLKGLGTAPPLSPLVHVHGLAFSAWIVFFLVQTSLVAARRTRVHKRLGYAVAVLALLLLPLGYQTAVAAARRGSAPPGVPPLAFLVVPLLDLVVFATFVGAGLWLRRQSAAHKRLMLLATIAMLTPAIARLPGMLALGLPAIFGLTDLFVVGCLVYDRVTLGRFHPATVWGGLFLVVSQPLRLVIAGTGAWLAFASWLTA